MNNEEKLGVVMGLLVDILKARLEAMKANPEEMNVSLLKETRELLKQHAIEMDPTSAPMQDLKNDLEDELARHRASKSG